MMSSPVPSCDACQRPFGEASQPVRGSCGHDVSRTCIGGDNGNLMRPTLPCPVAICEQGRFGVGGEQCRKEGIHNVINLGSGSGGDVVRDAPPKPECASSSDILVAPIPEEVVSGSKRPSTEVNNATSETSLSNPVDQQVCPVKSEGVVSSGVPLTPSPTNATSAYKHTLTCARDDESSRFSNVVTPDQTDMKKEETDDEAREPEGNGNKSIAESDGSGNLILCKSEFKTETDDEESRSSLASEKRSNPKAGEDADESRASHISDQDNMRNGLQGDAAVVVKEETSGQTDMRKEETDDEAREPEDNGNKSIAESDGSGNRILCKSEFKAETDDEESSSSLASEKKSNPKAGEDADESRASHISDQDNMRNGLQGDEVTVKEEMTYDKLHSQKANDHRKYGDRVLLARQSNVGMMKLGGGNQSSDLYPKDHDKREARMGGRYAIAYNCMWNFGAPKYAGQPSAFVTMLPCGHWDDDDHDYDATATPFSVFVMRRVKGSTLGWEYCGDYIRPIDDLEGGTAAHSVSSACKKSILHDILTSLDRANGEWHGGISHFRDEIAELCRSDSSPAGPTRLIRLAKNEPEPNDEGKEREERLDGESREKASSAAKARALGLDKKISDKLFAERLVEYDDFYRSYVVKFVRYDEEMYKFVKEGATMKNKFNKRRADDEPCALASDWYNIDDQKLGEFERDVNRKPNNSARTSKRKRIAKK